MALNKYMHPRNIYKTPPDFSKLAKEFPDFLRITKTDVTGKISIDFKDPQSLRILTKCLLMSDFNLDVNIPDDKLVPTLPLRLNYILWLEDLLNSIKKDDVTGLDIGTGACAIYPLLAAKKNQWHMVGTESDSDSFLKAQENIQKNKLESLIEIKKNSSSTLITNLFTDETQHIIFDFCMCNPPFYSSIQELYESRSPARPPPKNGFTGSPHELITEGGELEFCRKLIKESKDHKNKISIFTTMVGHKYNLAELIQDLKADKIIYTHTEFCQGRVTRWGLAWTFQNYDIHILVPSRDKLRKKNLPLTYLLPELPNCVYNVETAFTKLKIMLIGLNMIYKVIEKRGNYICLDVIAKTNTWSNQRRKKRMMKIIESKRAKKIKLDSSDKVDAALDSENDIKIDESTSLLCNGSAASPKPESNEHTQNVTETEYVIHAILKIIKKENDLLLQMELVDGTASKEGLHQIIQYIKNNWK